MRNPLTTTALMTTLAFLASTISAQAACDLPIRQPEPDENGQVPETGHVGLRQAEGALQYDMETGYFVRCIEGVWVPQKRLRGRG